MKYLLFPALAASLLACNTSDQKGVATNTNDSGTVQTANPPASQTAERQTTIEWLDATTQDLGTLTKGQVVEVSWRLKNTGTAPLIITDAVGGCGCTVPEKPTEPVAPGAETVIKAKFNSENFTGHVKKDVTVTANNSNPNEGAQNKLYFTADIKEK